MREVKVLTPSAEMPGVLPSVQTIMISGHKGVVTSVALSSDNRYLVSGSVDQTIRVLDLESQRQVLKIEEHDGAVSAVSFSSDGCYVISASCLRFFLWDINTGREVHRFEDNIGYARGVEFSSDGKYAVARSGPPYIKEGAGNMSLWDIEGRKRIGFFSGYTPGGHSIAISHDGRLVLTGHDDGNRLWDAQERNLIGTFEPPGLGLSQAHCLDFSSNGRMVISGHDRLICIWDVEERHILRWFDAHEGPVTAVAFSPDDQQILSGGEDNLVRLSDTDEGREICKLMVRTVANSVVFSSDGRIAASGGRDHQVCIWHLPQR